MFSGKNKGYGIVLYPSIKGAVDARRLLDMKEVDGQPVICEFVGSGVKTFESLNSMCLYVDCLPKDFHDMCEFRKIFSTIVNPAYCQVRCIIYLNRNKLVRWLRNLGPAIIV